MATRVLIIDDEKWIGALVGDYLSENGYEVLSRMSLAEGRAELSGPVLPDVILLDVMLPDGNGMDYLKELRATPRTRTLPIIMITAHKIDTQDRIHGFDEGADDYLVKPFDLGELRSRIDRLINRVIRTQKNEEPPPPVRTAEIPQTPVVPPQQVTFKSSRPILFNRFTQLLLTPTQFFQATQEPDAALAFTTITLASVFMGLQNGFEGNSMALGFVSIFSFLGAAVIGVAVLAWFLQWMMGLRRQSVLFRNIAAGVALGFAPLVLCGLLGLVYVVAADGKMGDFTAGPLLLFPAQGTSSPFGFLLRRLDLFEIWAVLLVAKSFAESAAQKKRYAFILFGLLWVGVVGVLGLANRYL